MSQYQSLFLYQVPCSVLAVEIESVPGLTADRQVRQLSLIRVRKRLFALPVLLHFQKQEGCCPCNEH